MSQEQQNRVREIQGGQRAGRSARRETMNDGEWQGEQALATLVSEHYVWIQRYCRRFMQHDADALDAAQEVVIKMHRSLPDFAGRSSIRTWLSSIVRSECIDMMRRTKRHRLTPSMEGLLTIHQQIARDECEPGEETGASVDQALAMLAERDKEILYLRFFRDLPIAAISEWLGLSVSAAKMRLYRALAAFKAAYETAQKAPESSVHATAGHG